MNPPSQKKVYAQAKREGAAAKRNCQPGASKPTTAPRKLSF